MKKWYNEEYKFEIEVVSLPRRMRNVQAYRDSAW